MTVGVQAPAYATATNYFGGLQTNVAQSFPTDIQSLMTAVEDPDRTPETVPPGGTSQKGRYSQPTAIGGKLVDATGVPMPNVLVQVSLEPGPALLGDNKNDAVGLPLSQVSTDANGKFNLPVPALKNKNIKGYIEGDGGVTLLFSAFGADWSEMQSLPVMLPTSSPEDPVYGTVWAMVEDDTMLDPAMVQTALDAQAAGTLSPQIGSGIVAENITLTAVQAGITPSAGGTSTGPDPDFDPLARCTDVYGLGSAYKWVRSSTPYVGYIPLQRLQTGNKMTGTYEWSNSNNMEVKVGMDYTYKNVTAQGGYSHSVSSESGMTFPTQGHNTIYQYSAQWDFRYYTLECTAPSNNTTWYNGGVKELKPYQWAGGFCTTCAYYGYSCNTTYLSQFPAGATAWASRTTSYSRLGGVSVNGFSLDSSQTNGDSWKKTYKNTASTDAYMCGDNTWYLYTDRASEHN